MERLCDKVTIIRAGKTVESGTLDQRRHLTRSEVAFTATDSARTQLAGSGGIRDLAYAGGRLTFTADSDQLTAVLPLLASLKVQGLTITPPSLEELFLRHYGDELAADGVEAGLR